MRIDGQTVSAYPFDVYAAVAGDLERAQQLLVQELATDQPVIRELCEHIRQYHGKLLRPALLLLSARACGGVRPEHHVLAAVVELVHLATLVHDDVLDEADLRRGAPTVNRLRGNEQAVLLGDFLYSHAFRLCSSLSSSYAARVIGQTAVTLCEGEMMQIAARWDLALTEARYLEMIARKTASLVETCCHLGAYYAGADRDTVQRLSAFGRAVGLAFQIVDDLLDLTGSEAVVGKSLGRDLAEGELTLPVLHALRTASPEHRDRLTALLDSPGAQQRQEISDLLAVTGSLSYADDVARRQVEIARQALRGLRPSAARDHLLTVAEFVLQRRH